MEQKLAGVTLNNFRKKQLVVIIGPSGCGKTTLLKLINRIETPTSGEIYVEEKAISSVDPVELRGKQLDMLFNEWFVSTYDHRKNAALVPNLKGCQRKKRQHVFMN